MVFCDYALINVFVAFPGGETISGQLAAKFARTWKQFPSANGQVWRFLVNGDLTCLPNASTAYGCTSPLPRCAFPLPNAPIHFDGHVDYCCDPATPGTMTASMSLSHFQGCISHAPWSCKPIAGFVGHEESSYHLVGPAPFTFGAGVEPQGPIYAGSVRASYPAARADLRLPVRGGSEGRPARDALHERERGMPALRRGSTSAGAPDP